MLPKKQRITRSLRTPLTQPADSAHSPFFYLKFVSASTGETRLGVSVSKKVAKSAVDRNTLRRRVYSALLTLVPRLKVGLYALSAKPGAEGLRGEALRQELEKIFAKFTNK